MFAGRATAMVFVPCKDRHQPQRDRGRQQSISARLPDPLAGDGRARKGETREIGTGLCRIGGAGRHPSRASRHLACRAGRGTGRRRDPEQAKLVGSPASPRDGASALILSVRYRIADHQPPGRRQAAALMRLTSGVAQLQGSGSRLSCWRPLDPAHGKRSGRSLRLVEKIPAASPRPAAASCCGLVRGPMDRAGAENQPLLVLGR